jgi:hypothetical protein
MNLHGLQAVVDANAITSGLQPKINVQSGFGLRPPIPLPSLPPPEGGGNSFPFKIDFMNFHGLQAVVDANAITSELQPKISMSTWFWAKAPDPVAISTPT